MLLRVQNKSFEGFCDSNFYLKILGHKIGIYSFRWNWEYYEPSPSLPMIKAINDTPITQSRRESRGGLQMPI